ncbi:3-keto-disaccharide hydrolase [Spirosoma gilvum]
MVSKRKVNVILLLVAAFAIVGTSTSCIAQKKKDGYVSIFDGKSLKGWDGDPNYWRVEDGCLTGEITPEKLLKTNSFIIWQGGEPGDFELKGEFKITEAGNSGINYRSDRLPDVPFALRGYQADIDGKMRYTGQNYEERKRTTLAYRGQKTTIGPYTGESTPEAIRANVKANAWTGMNVTGSLGSSDSLKTFIKSEDWNTFHLVIKGNRLQHYINDVLMSEVIDDDTVNRKAKGLLGVQVHVGPPMKVQYRNLMIKQ